MYARVTLSFIGNQLKFMKNREKICVLIIISKNVKFVVNESSTRAYS